MWLNAWEQLYTSSACDASGKYDDAEKEEERECIPIWVQLFEKPTKWSTTYQAVGSAPPYKLDQPHSEKTST